MRRGLLLVALVCLGVYGEGVAERWQADLRSRAWLSGQATSPDAVPQAGGEPTPAAAVEGSGDAPAAAVARFAALAPGSPVGRLAIPALGVEGAVEHGDGNDVLRRAIGHLPGTALPGEGGHVVLAGHRDSFFRGLRRATLGQRIVLETPAGVHDYRIDDLRIVGPRDVEVLAPTDSERLTLVTCYPFDYIGPAPRRFIVTAVPVGSATSL